LGWGELGMGVGVWGLGGLGWGVELGVCRGGGGPGGVWGGDGWGGCGWGRGGRWMVRGG